MSKLFEESEIFTKERPSKLTKIQSKELYNTLAKEIIDNGWSTSTVEEISEDLESVSRHSTGFELAKELDDVGYYGNIDSQFIEWLEDFDSRHQEIIDENIKTWVTAHKIEPKHSVGTELKINKQIIHYTEGYGVGSTVFVNGYKKELGCYYISKIKGNTSNYVVEYETVESNTENELLTKNKYTNGKII